MNYKLSRTFIPYTQWHRLTMCDLLMYSERTDRLLGDRLPNPLHIWYHDTSLRWRERGGGALGDRGGALVVGWEGLEEVRVHF